MIKFFVFAMGIWLISFPVEAIKRAEESKPRIEQSESQKEQKESLKKQSKHRSHHDCNSSWGQCALNACYACCANCCNGKVCFGDCFFGKLCWGNPSSCYEYCAYTCH